MMLLLIELYNYINSTYTRQYLYPVLLLIVLHHFLDLREIKINSTEEALQLLRVGLRHRHIAGTRLNYQSSRSHAIFTIKIVRVVKSTRRPRVARVNRLIIHFIYIHVHVRVRNNRSILSGQLVRAYHNLTGHFLKLDGQFILGN